MTDASLSKNFSRSFVTRGTRDAIPEKTTPLKPGLLCRVRTMGRVDFRGMTVDVTPAEIGEDLDYGRD